MHAPLPQRIRHSKAAPYAASRARSAIQLSTAAISRLAHLLECRIAVRFRADRTSWRYRCRALVRPASRRSRRARIYRAIDVQFHASTLHRLEPIVAMRCPGLRPPFRRPEPAVDVRFIAWASPGDHRRVDLRLRSGRCITAFRRNAVPHRLAGGACPTTRSTIETPHLRARLCSASHQPPTPSGAKFRLAASRRQGTRDRPLRQPFPASYGVGLAMASSLRRYTMRATASSPFELAGPRPKRQIINPDSKNQRDFVCSPNVECAPSARAKTCESQDTGAARPARRRAPARCRSTPPGRAR